MAEKINDGGSAFPLSIETSDGFSVTVHTNKGMSLRDYFAGHALSGILAGGFADTIPHDDVNGGGDAAFFAYQYADAMLLARQSAKAEGENNG